MCVIFILGLLFAILCNVYYRSIVCYFVMLIICLLYVIVCNVYYRSTVCYCV